MIHSSPVAANHRSTLKVAARSWATTVSCLVTAACCPSLLADHPASIERIGRCLGVGWGDGYHVCRDAGCRPGADLPPLGYPHQFGTKQPVATCGEVYPPGAAIPRHPHHQAAGGCDQTSCDAPCFDAAIRYETAAIGDSAVSPSLRLPSPSSLKSPQQIETQSLHPPQIPAAGLSRDHALPNWLEELEIESESVPAIDFMEPDSISSHAAAIRLPAVLPDADLLDSAMQPTDWESLFSKSESVSAITSPATAPIRPATQELRFLPKVRPIQSAETTAIETPVANAKSETLKLKQPSEQGSRNHFFDSPMPVQIAGQKTSPHSIVMPQVQPNPFFQRNGQAESVIADNSAPRVAAARTAGTGLDWNPVHQPE